MRTTSENSAPMALSDDVLDHVRGGGLAIIPIVFAEVVADGRTSYNREHVWPKMQHRADVRDYINDDNT